MSEVCSLSSESSEFDPVALHSMPVLLILLSQTGEYIIIGRRKFKTTELAHAFGGTMNPGLAPYKHDNINPAPLGLWALSLTLFSLGLFQAQAMGVKTPNVAVGLACFYGGGAQFLAGIGEAITGNSFGFLALCSLGSFCMLFAANYIDSFGIGQAYADDPDQIGDAVGFYYLAWAIVLFILMLVTVRATVAFFMMFLTIFMMFVLFAAGSFAGSVGTTKAGGVFAVIASVLCGYNAWAGIVNTTNSYVTPHPVDMPQLDLRKQKKEELATPN